MINNQTKNQRKKRSTCRELYGREILKGTTKESEKYGPHTQPSRQIGMLKRERIYVCMIGGDNSARQQCDKTERARRNM